MKIDSCVKYQNFFLVLGILCIATAIVLEILSINKVHLFSGAISGYSLGGIFLLAYAISKFFNDRLKKKEKNSSKKVNDSLPSTSSTPSLKKIKKRAHFEMRTKGRENPKPSVIDRASQAENEAGVAFSPATKIKNDATSKDLVVDDFEADEPPTLDENEPFETFEAPFIDSKKERSLFNRLHFYATGFANNKITEMQPSGKEWTLPIKGRQPSDNRVKQLATLFDHFYKLFEEEILSRDNPWNDDSELPARFWNIADDCFKIAFALSHFTLSEIQNHVGMKKTDHDKEEEFAATLTNSSVYSSHSFFCFPLIYHFLRGGVCRINGNEKPKIGFKGPCPQNHESLFYIEGTKQFEWRMLYNYFCRQFREFAVEGLIEDEDDRYLLWTIEDNGSESFTQQPASLPHSTF